MQQQQSTAITFSPNVWADMEKSDQNWRCYIHANVIPFFYFCFIWRCLIPFRIYHEHFSSIIVVDTVALSSFLVRFIQCYAMANAAQWKLTNKVNRIIICSLIWLVLCGAWNASNAILCMHEDEFGYVVLFPYSIWWWLWNFILFTLPFYLLFNRTTIA